MFEIPETDLWTTDGEIAVINLESARRRSWSRFFQDPLREGVAETVVEHEKLTSQFVGDLAALDRLESLVNKLVQIDDRASSRAALVQAQVASMMHRFADARQFLTLAELGGAPPTDVNRLRSNIDQACGSNLDKVLDERSESAKSGRTEDLIPLGALLADLCEFNDADRTYRQALQNYRDVSPFPVALVCFQLGILWGSSFPSHKRPVPHNGIRKPSTICRHMLKHVCTWRKSIRLLVERAMRRRCSSRRLRVATQKCVGVSPMWRRCKGKPPTHTPTCRRHSSDSKSLLKRHLLAFADHGAEFYAGSGADCSRALDLARVNVANRPTLRAFEQAHMIALCAGDAPAASELLAAATKHWGATRAFRLSPLKKDQLEKREGAAA